MNIKSIIHVFQAVVLTAVVVAIGSAWATEYTLTARVQCEEKGINGLPSGKRMCDLLSTDILNVTKSNGQMYFCGSSSTTYNVNCPITVKGNGKDGEATGKFRMQLSSGYTVNINGVVTMTGDTVVSAHTNGQNWGNLKFNNQITGSASLIIAPGNKTPTYLNNATANKNNYTGNTQIGASGLYQSNAGGYLYLAQDEQIPDVSTNGTSCKGNLVLANSSTLNLNGHKETINGISSDTGSVITGNSSSTLTVGANNSTSTYSGNLTGSMNLTKIGTGTLIISNSGNAYTGGTTINEGTVKVTGNGKLGTGSVFIGAGTNLEYTGTASNSVAHTMTGSGTLKFVGNGTNSSEYKMFDSNLSTFAGNVIIDGARVQAKETQDIGNTTTNTNIDIKTGGQLYLPSGSVTANFTIAGTGTTEGLGAIRIDGATLNGNVTLSGDASIRNYLGGNSTINSKIDLAGHTLTFGLSYNTNKTVLNGAISDSSTGTKGSVVYATKADSWFDGIRILVERRFKVVSFTPIQIRLLEPGQ